MIHFQRVTCAEFQQFMGDHVYMRLTPPLSMVNGHFCNSMGQLFSMLGKVEDFRRSMWPGGEVGPKSCDGPRNSILHEMEMLQRARPCRDIEQRWAKFIARERKKWREADEGPANVDDPNHPLAKEWAARVAANESDGPEEFSDEEWAPVRKMLAECKAALAIEDRAEALAAYERAGR